MQNNFEKGEIIIGGKQVSGEMKRGEFEKTFGVKPRFSIGGNFSPRTRFSDECLTYYSLEGIEIDDVSFDVGVTFTDDNLYLITLSPIFPDIEENYNIRGYAVEKHLEKIKAIRAKLDVWLASKMDAEPCINDDNETVYAFENIVIATESTISSYDNGRMDAIGGNIEIRYLDATDLMF